MTSAAGHPLEVIALSRADSVPSSGRGDRECFSHRNRAKCGVTEIVNIDGPVIPNASSAIIDSICYIEATASARLGRD
jgi:hypothetical protein